MHANRQRVRVDLPQHWQYVARDHDLAARPDRDVRRAGIGLARPLPTRERDGAARLARFFEEKPVRIDDPRARALGLRAITVGVGSRLASDEKRYGGGEPQGLLTHDALLPRRESEQRLRRGVLTAGCLLRTRPGWRPACLARYGGRGGRSMDRAQFVARFCDTYNMPSCSMPWY